MSGSGIASGRRQLRSPEDGCDALVAQDSSSVTCPPRFDAKAGVQPRESVSRGALIRKRTYEVFPPQRST